MSMLCGNPPPSNLHSLCGATNIAFIQPVLEKKKGQKQVFQRTNTVWGVRGARVNLTSRDLTDLKVQLKIYGGMFGRGPR